jgi:glycosyltransferase involved in cell wall biosynthesis
MKILLIVHHPLDRNAGAPGVTWQLGQEYQKLGHEVQYYSFDNLPAKLHGMLGSVMFPEFVASHILSLCQRHAVDLVDASTGDAWVWAKFYRRFRANLPLLVTRSHGLEHILHLEQLEEAELGNLRLTWKYPLYHGGFRLWEVATSLRHADLAFFLNQRDLKYAVDRLGVKLERARTVTNGIPEAFLNLTLEPLPTSEGSTVGIAQVGSYIPRKGIDYGTPALNAILTRYPQVKVSFLGTGCPESQVYADFAPHMRDRIQVVSQYNHEFLPSLLQGHQIKLLPSLSEGFSLALTEAMACGLAPVTTATPGPIEIVRDGDNGILCPVRNSQAIEQALERLITDRTYLESLRRNARATAQNYSWSCVARKNLSFYEETFNQTKSPT